MATVSAPNRPEGLAELATGTMVSAWTVLLTETKAETWVNKDPGHASFAEMLKALDSVVEIKKGEKDHLVRLR